MDVFEKWKMYSLFAILMLPVYTGNCESSGESGTQCIWLNDTNSSCEMCNLLNVKTLDCFNKSLETVTVKGSHEIVGLNVSNNQLSTTPLIDDCPNLEWIDLSRNSLRVMNEAAFRNIKINSLRILNLSNCGLLNIMPVLIKEFLPSLEILLMVDNFLSSLNMTMFEKMEAFCLLDVRNNGIKTFTHIVEDQCVTILVNQSDCNHPCGQNFCHQSYDFDYLLSICQSDRQCSSNSHASSQVCPHISSTAPGNTTASDKNTATYEMIVKVVVPCSSVVLVLLISYQVRRYYKRKRRQNQYNRWLAVYTPAEYACTFQKRVSFSGEIVIKQSGENMTQKKLNSDELKRSCSRQFDISLLIRTQSLPPVEREEETGKSGRVLSWI